MRREHSSRTGLPMASMILSELMMLNSSRVEAEAKHFFYETKPKNGHGDRWLQSDAVSPHRSPLVF